ncbi:cytidine deaminase [Rodentibacter pneumotropicus]|uniref:Cytidine deaminase n=2 Tax=Rodentibacter pneumotropicus TaxID=758 RepID=A0A4S2Q0B3_9PAST|nr:cytidine deaminase [Rodentibacter pneumotropicus]TGZ99871.1 cytidine deaminase [Rodentibacter pneumotropicus]THA02803.1 cytidine deaminase [Rodentibacter pneumotropicus]THA09872.1 cytidine deaminase [Rodentibacter pneumotropicus]THA15423.1 cytidine deaminase [Rodentibacter pneumotropicus]
MQELIKHALPLDVALNQAIVNELEEGNWAGFLTAQQVERLCLDFRLESLQLAIHLLPIAACYSHTAVSHFNVGAVAIGQKGDFYFGANQEFANVEIQQTIHAEQSAISHAWLRGETQIAHLAVNYTPCGHCRQFMNELQGAEKLQIHLPHCLNNPLYHYLPDSFGPKDLDITAHLLAKEDHHLIANHSDELINQAILAANQSHCPYSESPHGVAMLFKNGEIISGRYAENAAFNPSLPALQTALNFSYLNDKILTDIQRIVMVEKPAKLSHKSMTEKLLQALNLPVLEYVEV